MRLKITFIGIAAIAILAVGCGGGGGDTTGGGTGTGSTESASTDGTTTTNANGSNTSGKPLTKAVFIKEGDAICGKVPPSYEEKLKALEKENKGKKVSKEEENLKAAVPPLFVAAEEMEELGPPKGEEAKIEAIIDALEAAAKGIEAKPSSELSGPKSPAAEFQKLTGEYGFKVCTGL